MTRQRDKDEQGRSCGDAPQPIPMTIYDDEVLAIKMLIEDNANHDEEILKIVSDVCSRPLPATAPEPSYEELVKFARFTQKFWKEGQEIMRANNLCIDNIDDKMQKLAFTFYSNLCEINSQVEHLFQEGYGEEKYHDERLPIGQTYSAEHDARIRAEAIRQERERSIIPSECYKTGFNDGREKMLDEIFTWLCDCEGGDVVFNPKLGLFSSPQPFNTVGLVHKLLSLRSKL
jgi:hypothetical protein